MEIPVILRLLGTALLEERNKSGDEEGFRDLFSFINFSDDEENQFLELGARLDKISKHSFVFLFNLGHNDFQNLGSALGLFLWMMRSAVKRID